MRSPTGHPIVAAVMDVVMAPLDSLRPGVVGAARGRVLELGVGTGLNLPHYGADVCLHGIEPDPHMLRRARARAARLDLDVQLSAVSAEALPFDDDSFDVVTATFVFCTIPDAAAAAAEAMRVLRPGGLLLFAEHVRSSRPAMASLQTLIDPGWRWLAGGCSLTRDPVELLHQAGAVGIEVRARGSVWSPIPVVTGQALAPNAAGSTVP